MAAIPLPATPLSQRAEPSPLWSETSPKCPIRRGTTRIPRVGCGKAKRGSASRALPSLGATARRTRGVLVVRATPPFCRWCATGADKGGGQGGSPLRPVRGGRSHHSDPWREGIEPAGRLALGTAEPRQRTSRPQLAHWTRPTPGGPWPLRPMSGARNLTVANCPTVSCRVDP